mmetsp:Transcript_42367/g.68774  ORF Transcript_42367/g.68774 Transcript_42367/m.68774 type:complete len:100 (+) Transcript_42367:232-531(+)
MGAPSAVVAVALSYKGLMFREEKHDTDGVLRLNEVCADDILLFVIIDPVDLRPLIPRKGLLLMVVRAGEESVPSCPVGHFLSFTILKQHTKHIAIRASR